MSDLHFDYTKSRIGFDSHTKVCMTEHHQESHKQNRQKQKQRHACKTCAGPGFWDWLDCLRGFLFFLTFYKNICSVKRLWADWKRLLSELTGGRISRWGKDKRVRKREKYHSCVKKRRNRKEGFDGGNDSWDCAVAGDLGGTPNRCKLVWATSINSLLHLSKFLSATTHSSALQIKIYPAWISQPIGVVHTGR